MVFDLYQVAEIQAELIGGNGVVTEQVKRANLVSFTCLKALAFEQRFERKYAHDFDLHALVINQVGASVAIAMAIDHELILEMRPSDLNLGLDAQSCM